MKLTAISCRSHWRDPPSSTYLSAPHIRSWGAPRIHAELKKLGFTVSERTVSRYMPERPTEPDAIERWKVFLSNHRECIAAMDFFTVPTVTFQVLYVLIFIHHARRQILHFNVSAYPSTEWIIQQLRETFPYETAPRYLIFDRDEKFGPSVVTAMKAMGDQAVTNSLPKPVAERSCGAVDWFGPPRVAEPRGDYERAAPAQIADCLC